MTKKENLIKNLRFLLSWLSNKRSNYICCHSNLHYLFGLYLEVSITNFLVLAKNETLQFFKSYLLYMKLKLSTEALFMIKLRTK